MSTAPARVHATLASPLDSRSLSVSLTHHPNPLPSTLHEHPERSFKTINRGTSFCRKVILQIPIPLKVESITLAYKALDGRASPGHFLPPSPLHGTLATGLSSCSFPPVLLHFGPLCVRPAGPSSPSLSRFQLKYQLRKAVPGYPVSAGHTRFSPPSEGRLLEDTGLVCVVQ